MKRKPTTAKAKIEWLVNNRHMWKGLPRNSHFIYTDRALCQQHDEIVNKMKDDGLYSHLTLNETINLARLFEGARKRMRVENL